MARGAGEFSIPIDEVTSKITIRVRGLRGFQMRFWIARKLWMLGARIACVNVIVER